MKNLIFLACALCAVQAVPLPAEQPNELEILQIPLQGNKVCFVITNKLSIVATNLERTLYIAS